MDELGRFSVNDAKFKRLAIDGKSYIRKETRLHPSLQDRWLAMFRLILQYIDQLRRADIPIPEILETSASPEGLLFVCEDRGPNIIQRLSGRPESLLKEPAIDQILSILKKARDARLYFDPHIKNFVVDDGKVFYVDFTPPLTGDYFELRLSMADREEREILSPFFECMNPNVLGYHFAADLVKINPAYRTVLSALHGKLSGADLLEERDFSVFMEKADFIRQTELRREGAGVFLL